MAEGHAVIRWARRLAPLVGEPLVHVQMPKRWGERPQTLVGQRLLTPRTHGKHLLLPLSGGETLQQPSRFLNEIGDDLVEEWNLQSFDPYG